MVDCRSALIIADEVFRDPRLPPRPGLVGHASALADVLEDPRIGDFDVQTLVNPAAQTIRAGIADFFARRRPDDLLVVYYAGYGFRDADGELHLAAADTAADRLEATTVRPGFINRQIEVSGARNVVLLLDFADPAVFARGLVAKGGGGLGIEREFRGRGRMVIAASGGPGYASGESAFTPALVEGLAAGAADLDRNGRVGLDELYEYVTRRVVELPGRRVPGLAASGLEDGLYLTRGRPGSFGPPRRGGPPRPPESVTDPGTRGGYRGIDPSPPPGWQAPPTTLFWNTHFPQNPDILLGQPPVLAAGTQYRLETGLGPKPEPGALTSPQSAARLLDRQIRYRLEAENGEFRLPYTDRWRPKAESAAMTCTAVGTDAFGVYYRAAQAGPATIRAFLIVDNGSVDQLDIELQATADEGEAVPPVGASGLLTRSVGRSVQDAPSPDYRLSIRRSFADLWHQNIQVDDVDPLPPELAGQLDRVARDLYETLRQISLDHPLQGGDQDRPLRVRDPAGARLRLAQAGAELHYRLFREPLLPVPGGLPAGLGAMADYLRERGDQAAPPLLQIVARDFPLPWGLLYDRGDSLRTPDDVDPAGFWGRRFDIYRSVVSVDRPTRRGKRRWVKPVIGGDVPRNQEQRDFVEDLRADLSDSLLRVEGTISTVPDLMDWATSGRDSDLVYLFCHARPAHYDSRDAGARANWLGLGATEDDDRVALDDLERWWGKQRQTNPIVILNACSSGQQDLLYGAPFVDFFMNKWGAQAFIGTDWPINASFADVFGRRLLQEILVNRLSLREAFRAVSDAAAADDNFFPLMYAVYGLNTVQFTDPLSP